MSTNGYSDLLLTSLTDDGKIAFCAICSSILRDLYFNDCKQFYLEAYGSILKMMAMDYGIDSVAREFHKDNASINNYKHYFKILSQEKILTNGMGDLVKELIYVALRQGYYDARWRVMIKRLAEVIKNCQDIETYEASAIDFLLNDGPSEEEKKMSAKKEFLSKIKRYSLISAVTIGGGAIAGITGGLAAPVIFESLALVASSSTVVAALSGTAGSVLVSSLFGGVTASLVGYKMTKRFGGLKEFTFEKLKEDNKSQLSYAIAIASWINDPTSGNYATPWEHLWISKEQYCLRYESDNLVEVGIGIQKSASATVVAALKSSLIQGVIFQVPKQALKRVIWPLALLELTAVIDIPWSVGCSKAILAGQELANVLLTKNNGWRPVTLVGYSLGARVIYYCLLELSKVKSGEGIVEDAYLIGAPCPADPKVWNNFTKVVAGTITNGYSESDKLLKFMYRTLSLPIGGVAGVKNIEVDHERIRNVNLTEIIPSHSEYPKKLNEILRKMNVRLNDLEVTTP